MVEIMLETSYQLGDGDSQGWVVGGALVTLNNKVLFLDKVFGGISDFYSKR